MDRVNTVVCKKCGATFRNRRFWALPKNDSPRKRCPRCWTVGPFEEAKKEDIEAFSKNFSYKLNIFGITEIIIGLLTIAAIIFGLIK